jgi:phosphohistidine phosphatase SixA
MDYLLIIVNSLQELTDFVLIYEHCNCIHEMVKEINIWSKKSDKDKSGIASLDFNFNEGNEEE